MQGNIKPTGKRVLLKRLDGDGREEQLASGIWKPARDESLRHGNAERVPDTFRAQVLAMSDGATKATQGELREGDAVLVHTYEQTNQRTLTGDETPYGILVDVDNVIGVERPCAPPSDLSCFATPKREDFIPLLDAADANEREREQAVLSLGYHRRSGF